MAVSVCKLSIVCPAFEEEEVLPHFHAELCATLATLEPEYEVEIVYIDDGSRDGTLEYLRHLAAPILGCGTCPSVVISASKRP